jgi:hypothetical protein
MDISIQGKQADFDVTLEKIQRQHEIELAELEEKLAEQSNQLESQRALPISSTDDDHDDSAALENLKAEYASAFSELSESHRVQIEQHEADRENQRVLFEAQLADTKRFMDISIQGKQADFDITLEKIQRQHAIELDELDSKLRKQTEQHAMDMSELKQQLEEQQTELVLATHKVQMLEHARLEQPEDSTMSKTGNVNELQETVAKLTKCVEEEKAKNRELIDEALDLEDDLVALQDAAVEANRYKCQVEDLEKEMERSRKDYEEEIVKLEQQIEDLYKIQIEDTQQTKPRSTMTALESGMLEQLQDKILDMELSHEQEVAELQRQIDALELMRSTSAVNTNEAVGQEGAGTEADKEMIRKLTGFILVYEEQLRNVERQHEEEMAELTRNLINGEVGKDAFDKTGFVLEIKKLQDKIAELQDQVDFLTEEKNKTMDNSFTVSKEALNYHCAANSGVSSCNVYKKHFCQA